MAPKGGAAGVTATGGGGETDEESESASTKAASGNAASVPPTTTQSAVDAAPIRSTSGRRIEPERSSRWADLLRDRPSTGDSNAMSSWLLEVLAVSDLEKPLAAKGSAGTTAGAERAVAAMAGIAADADSAIAPADSDTPKETKESEKELSLDNDAVSANDSKKRDRSKEAEEPVGANVAGDAKKAKTDGVKAAEEEDASTAPEIVGEAV